MNVNAAKLDQAFGAGYSDLQEYVDVGEIVLGVPDFCFPMAFGLGNQSLLIWLLKNSF